MLRALRPSPTLRSAIIIAASAALILPLPARCLSCSNVATDCSSCQQSHPSTPKKTTSHSCCERHTTTAQTAKPKHDCNSHAGSKPCGCKLHAPDRNYVTDQRQTVAHDLVAVLPTAERLLATDFNVTHAITASHRDAPPPVPHRILHCSWII